MSDETHTSAEKGPERSEDPAERETRNQDIMREIGLDEFQPKGTMTLALIYFVIVVLMWIFMYFFEFAGNGPSIIG